ncbi:response regulator [Spirosoma daeguense]
MVDIVYVEDNPDDADIFTRLISKLEKPISYTILGSGSEAIDYLTGKGRQKKNTLPKLLLLDLNLVGLSGFDVIRNLRAVDHTRWLPIVTFSTSDSPNDIREAYAAGINAYIVKPGNYQATRLLLQRLCQFWLENNTLHSHS